MEKQEKKPKVYTCSKCKKITLGAVYLVNWAWYCEKCYTNWRKEKVDKALDV